MAFYTPAREAVKASEVWAHLFKLLMYRNTMSSTASGTPTTMVTAALGNVPPGRALVFRAECMNGSPVLIASRNADDPTYGTETILESGFDTAPLKDFSEQTVAYPATNPIPATTTIDLAQWDLGTAQDVFVYAYHYTDASDAYVTLFASPDCTTWTQIYSVRFGARRMVFVNARCIKLSVYNSGSSDLANTYWKIYNLEIYPARQVASGSDLVLESKRLAMGYVNWWRIHPSYSDYCELYSTIW